MVVPKGVALVCQLLVIRLCFLCTRLRPFGVMSVVSAVPELLFLLRKEKVEQEIIDKLTTAGVLTMKTFANLAADVDSMRKIGTDDLGIGAEGLANKVKMATFCRRGRQRSREPRRWTRSTRSR